MEKTRKFELKSPWLIILLPIAIIIVLCSIILGLASGNQWNTLNFASLINNDNNTGSTSTDLHDGDIITAESINTDGITIKFDLELALSSQEQQIGLMYRQDLDEDSGMLFVFSDSKTRTFWMKNTYIPLDMAFLDANKQIINVSANTEPLNTEKAYTSANPAMYVIEMNAGWFAKNHLEQGSVINFKI